MKKPKKKNLNHITNKTHPSPPRHSKPHSRGAIPPYEIGIGRRALCTLDEAKHRAYWTNSLTRLRPTAIPDLFDALFGKARQLAVLRRDF